MLLVAAFAFLAGVVTVLSPCILPVLPIVLASALGGSRLRPLGVVLGLVASFTLFTLTLTALVGATGVSADALRVAGGVVIGLFGIVLVVPRLQSYLEVVTGRLAGRAGGTNALGFGGGLIVGASLGLVWAPCAGPILASVTTLAATNRVGPEAAAIALAYALGAGLPMLLIAYGGRGAMARVRGLGRHTPAIQRAFGVVMVLFALSFLAGYDRQIQTALVEAVPIEWTNRLLAIEDQPAVREQLDRLLGRTTAVPVSPAADSGGLPAFGPAP